MKPISIPPRLRELLGESEFEASTLQFAEEVGTLLGGTSMPFFPAFTDHGTEHVERVLEAVVRLIPAPVWESGLLQPADGAVLVCASMLHDLGMYVQEAGFVELVGTETRFEPRPWFCDSQAGREPDLSWPDLWTSFQREARHFSTSQIELILGPQSSDVLNVAHEDDLCAAKWTQADRQLIGEFLRRNHARLAHEIAIYGFPGSDRPDFPVLASTLPSLAEAIGAVARSHNESLRTLLGYLNYLEPGSQRPMGAFLPYHMGLLRVADYLQIEAKRAPPLLLRLKAPLSPLSIAEWDKHGAVSSIGWDHDDSLAIIVRVSPQHGLRAHLALEGLIADLQAEFDTTVAVLGEVYSRGKFEQLRLARQRVITNLDERSVHDQLPYVPRRAALRSDPDLFRLVIRDLYGNHRQIAGRELIQNAVDAVRARRAMEARHGRKVAKGKLRRLDADVVVTIEECGEARWSLNVADTGIGMTPELVIDYFLQAGASFGPTASEINDLTHEQAVGSMKAGRFGVGAFAAFLLGPEVQVTTRHMDADRAVSFRARIDEDLVQLDWADAPIGTEVRIPFGPGVSPRASAAPDFSEALLQEIKGFYRLRDPKIRFVLRLKESSEESAGPADVPAPRRKLPDEWRTVKFDGVDSIMWQVPRNLGRAPWRHGRSYGALIHNGIQIEDPRGPGRTETYAWSDWSLRDILERPRVAVFDSRHAVGVALHRYNLVDPALPFERELLESIGTDLLAHGLVAGPKNHPLLRRQASSPVFSRTTWLPMLAALLDPYLEDDDLLVLWCHDTRAWNRRGTEHRLPDPGSATSKDFIAARTKLPWRGFPHRAVVSIDDSYGQEPQSWAQVLLRVGREADELSREVGLRHRATVALGGNVQSDPSFYPGRRRWKVHRSDRLGLPLVFSEGDDSIDLDSSVFHAAAEAAERLYVAGSRDGIALSVFGRVDRPLRECEKQLVAPWVRSVGGSLPRRKDERKTTMDELVKSGRALRSQVNKWRRSLE